MIIWFIFFLVVYVLIHKYGTTSSSQEKKLYIALFLVTIVYFAAFRDGIGSDYTAYKSYCERDVLEFGSLLAQEPLAYALESFCYNTDFSAVIFFLVSSLIICTLCTLIYTKYDNAVIALFVFVTYTNLYLSSLNLVRQFVAAAIILYGAYYYIQKTRSPIFFVFVFLAFLFHKSSVLFVLIYFLRKTEINPIVWTIIILASWIINVQPLFEIPVIKNLLVISEYQTYISYNETSYSKFSMINLYMHIIVLLFIWKSNKMSNVKNKDHFYFVLKMTALSVVFSNMSANDLPFAYRYAIFCSVFIPTLFTYLPNIIDRKLIPMFVYIPLCVVIWAVFFNRQNDRVFCPQQILPIESIFDKNYKPYDNPDTIVL